MSILVHELSMRLTPREGALLRRLALVLASVLVAVVMAYLVTKGQWLVALALLVILPGFVLVHRAPLAIVGVWLMIVPLTLEIGGGARLAFWALHRAAPVGVAMVLVISGMLGIRSQMLQRIGTPELIMAGYLIATALSIGYAADDVPTEIIRLYDTVAIPMTLYLLVRVLRPTDAWFRYLTPVAVVTIVTQAMLGGLQWAAPSLLPSGWLGRAGSRTTGSLSSPSVYGVTMIAAGLILIHVAAHERRPHLRRLYRLLFMISLVMAVVTFTRAVWLAVILAVVVAAYLYPLQVRRVAILAIPLLVALTMSGAIGSQIEKIETRFASEETALSRLPVIYASIDMFEAKPLTGWGYGNFDKFDREFQRQVNGFFPEKDQASHNVYLTLAAEQGSVGFVLFIGPALWWLMKSRYAYARLPQTGLISRKFLIVLWAILACHVVVNNFSNMKVAFGLGQWWLILGLIASLVSTQTDVSRDSETSSVLEWTSR